jgi:hypothetical protein
VKRELSIYFCRVIRFLTVLGRFPRRSGFGFRAADAVDDAERLAVKAEIEAENAETTAEESPGTASSGRDPHSPEGENAHPSSPSPRVRS